MSKYRIISLNIELEWSICYSQHIVGIHIQAYMIDRGAKLGKWFYHKPELPVKTFSLMFNHIHSPVPKEYNSVFCIWGEL